MIFAIVSSIIMAVFIFAVLIWSPYKAITRNRAARRERQQGIDSANRHRAKHGMPLLDKDGNEPTP